jgi:lysophospholipase L1-like esterase
MTARRRRAVALLMAVAVAAPAVAIVGPSQLEAQERRVVVVGDSVILGARSPLTAALAGRGWAVTFDAAVSRSTSAGLTAIESHRLLLTDTLVVSLGANDAGNTAAFRRRVQAILDATAGVPHVVWVTIREVRGYYGPANQAVREVAAGRPNVTVLDWHAATAGATDLTAGDGLHLNAAGAARMTQLVADAVVAGPTMRAAVPPPAQTSPPTTTTLPPTTTTAAPPTTAPPTTPTPTTTPTTAAPRTAAATRTAVPSERAAPPPAGRSPVASAPARAMAVGAALVLAIVALGGTRAAWTLARRGAGPNVPDDTQES